MYLAMMMALLSRENSPKFYPSSIWFIHEADRDWHTMPTIRLMRSRYHPSKSSLAFELPSTTRCLSRQSSAHTIAQGTHARAPVPSPPMWGVSKHPKGGVRALRTCSRLVSTFQWQCARRHPWQDSMRGGDAIPCSRLPHLFDARAPGAWRRLPGHSRCARAGVSASS